MDDLSAGWARWLSRWVSAQRSPMHPGIAAADGGGSTTSRASSPGARRDPPIQAQADEASPSSESGTADTVVPTVRVVDHVGYGNELSEIVQTLPLWPDAGSVDSVTLVATRHHPSSSGSPSAKDRSAVDASPAAGASGNDQKAKPESTVALTPRPRRCGSRRPRAAVRHLTHTPAGRTKSFQSQSPGASRTVATATGATSPTARGARKRRPEFGSGNDPYLFFFFFF